MNSSVTPKPFARLVDLRTVDTAMNTVAEHSSTEWGTSPRSVGFLTACSIVIANIIGTGIFTSLGFQLANIQSGFVLLMLWVVGGVAALCGALCYGELSAALPRSGGEYHFLSKIYHPALGFMAGFVSATVGFSAPIALAAMAFGKYLQGVLDFGSPVFFSFAVVWLVALFHLKNLRLGSVFQNLSTLIKLLLIAALVVAGFFVHPKQPIDFFPVPGDTTLIFGAPFAVALVYVMYSYSGWNAAVYITGEIKQPEKNVPRSLLVGTGMVIVLYVVLNAIFLATTPAQDLKDHWLLRLMGRKNFHGIPTNAIVLQLLIVNLLLLTRSFESVVQYTQFSLLLCSLFTVLGVIVLRITRPELARPYRVWAYPLPPIIFATITIWMMFYLLRWKTTESLAGLATAVVGLLLYFCALKRPHRSA